MNNKTYMSTYLKFKKLKEAIGYERCICKNIFYINTK